MSSESELRNVSSGVSVEEDGGEERFGSRRLVDRSAVLAVAAQCCYLPHDTMSRLEGCDDLGERVAGDWRSLALAIVATEVGRSSGEIQAVHRTLPHLVRLAGRFRSGSEHPSDEAEARLDAMLDGTYEAPLNTTGVYRGWPACREDAMSKPQVEAWTRSRLYDIAEQAGGSWGTAYEVIWIEAQKHAIQFNLTPEQAGRRRVWIGDGVTQMRDFWESSEHLFGDPDEAMVDQGATDAAVTVEPEPCAAAS